MSRILKLIAVCVALGLAWATPAHAFTDNVQSQQNGQSGPARTMALRGQYQLAAYEQLVNVQIYVLNAQGNITSSCQGTWNTKTGTWAAAIGDFQMASCVVQFKARYGPNAVYFYYNTPDCPWSKP
jgi:hypothetical protein